eukprot:15327938-Ditylum_brightwellii.AAC.1
MNLTSTNASSQTTPYRSGFPIDAIPLDPSVSPERKCLYQFWCGMLNWMAISTCPDISTPVSFLMSFNHCSSIQHIAAAQYVGRHALSTMNRGITFSSDQQSSLTLFLNVPFAKDGLAAFCDANWGHQDQSQSSLATKIALEKLCSISGHIIL